jgi:SAM-dependent methyltransferase
MMNDEKVANSVWNSIHEPITLSMIRTGASAPSAEEQAALMAAAPSTEETKSYYVRTAPRENFAMIAGLRDFHNQYIKSEILLKRALMGGRTRLLDVACGKGGDLFKWANLGVTHVLGVDSAGENITDPSNGAYQRYMKLLMSYRGKKTAPQIAFVMGNSAKPLVSGAAGANPQEADILRSVFGRVDTEGSVPSYIQSVMAGTFREGADVVACMFALHYFFESTTILDGFLANLAEVTKPGGVFVGCCFDGERVHDMLRGLDKGRSVVGTEGDATIWTITKQYDVEALSAEEDSVGLAIDVEFASIGSTHREYLVSFPYLMERLRGIGFRLLNQKELTEMGLQHSTNHFGASYEMLLRQSKIKSGDNWRYSMPDRVKEFSFLNRWFIVKREGVTGPPPEMPPIELQEAAQAAEAAEAPKAASIAAWEAPPPATKQYKKDEVFNFGLDAEESPVLLGDKFGGRWLGLGAPFPIPDPDDPTLVYPSGEHFLAGMRLAHASNQPDLARTLMSTQGKIHQDMAHVRLKETIAEESPRDFALLQREVKAIRESMDRAALATRGVTINEAAAMTRRDEDILYVLQYRFRRDKRFHALVEEAKNQHKYMLYTSKVESNAGGVPELSGVRHGVKKTITGSNKVGRLLMRVGGF